MINGRGEMDGVGDRSKVVVVVIVDEEGEVESVGGRGVKRVERDEVRSKCR